MKSKTDIMLYILMTATIVVSIYAVTLLTTKDPNPTTIFLEEREFSVAGFPDALKVCVFLNVETLEMIEIPVYTDAGRDRLMECFEQK